MTYYVRSGLAFERLCGTVDHGKQAEPAALESLSAYKEETAVVLRQATAVLEAPAEGWSHDLNVVLALAVLAGRAVTIAVVQAAR